MKNKTQLVCIAVSIFFAACNNNNTTNSAPEATVNTSKTPLVQVTADIETVPSPTVLGEDAVDDPSVWVHPSDNAKSLIVGTNKKGGLLIYNLKGEQLFYKEYGRLNNVDLIYGLDVNGIKTDVIAASNRTNNSILLATLDTTTFEPQLIHSRTITSSVDDVYGLCMYKDETTNTAFVVINGKNGEVEQWELFAVENGLDAKMVRKFDVGDQVEGMVVDTDTKALFIGEEENAIWKYSTDASSGNKREKVALSSPEENAALAYDIEGLSIYKAANGEGYLIASSQGNNTYALFNRKAPHAYIGSFKVVDGTVDGTEETDGLDVINLPMGDQFPDGFVIVQDGHNKTLAGEMETQNFKLISWSKIANSFTPKLITNN